MSDPRLLVIPRRLRGVRKIVAVMSSKGGVGKTIIATLLAARSASRGFKTGLLDLDFTNPSTHIVLGIDPYSLEYREEKGIEPPLVKGIRYMSIALFTGDNPTPLRGEAIDDAFKELLAITRWGELDLLFIDTPPGISNIHLNLLSYLGDHTEILLVATPSPLAVKSVEKLVKILVEGGYRIVGLVENMSNGKKLEKLCKKYSLKHITSIPYIEGVDERMGDINCLLNIKGLIKPIDDIIETII